MLSLMYEMNMVIVSVDDHQVISDTLFDILYNDEWNIGENIVSSSINDTKGHVYVYSANGVNDI
jgi:hypothetical protein